MTSGVTSGVTSGDREPRAWRAPTGAAPAGRRRPVGRQPSSAKTAPVRARVSQSFPNVCR